MATQSEVNAQTNNDIQQPINQLYNCYLVTPPRIKKNIDDVPNAPKRISRQKTYGDLPPLVSVIPKIEFVRYTDTKLK